MAFDTLAYAKHLEQAGVERRHTEAHAEAMNQYLRPDLPTKTDIDAFEQSTKADTAALRADIAALERSTKADIAALQSDVVALQSDIAALQSDVAALERSTKAEIAALERRIDQRLTVLEQSLRAEIRSEIAALEQRLQRLIHQTQLQTLGIMAAMLGILFALLRFTGHGG